MKIQKIKEDANRMYKTKCDLVEEKRRISQCLEIIVEYRENWYNSSRINLELI